MRLGLGDFLTYIKKSPKPNLIICMFYKHLFVVFICKHLFGISGGKKDYA